MKNVLKEITTKDYFQVELAQKSQVLIPIENTLEVLSIAPQKICPIPGVKQNVLGVSNYQGKLLWIVSINQALNIDYTVKNTVFQKRITVIVIKIKQQFLGIVVSKLKGMITVDTANFKQVLNEYFKAEIEHDNQNYQLLDLEKIFHELSLSPNS